MISTENLGAELVDLGQMIGLVGGDGNLNPNWFGKPLSEIASIFSDPTQRAGLMNFLDALLPPAALDGLPQGEKWHPLLGSDASLRGNLYLTVKDNGASVVFGLAGNFSTVEGTAPSASLRARLPLISANWGFTRLPVRRMARCRWSYASHWAGCVPHNRFLSRRWWFRRVWRRWRAAEPRRAWWSRWPDFDLDGSGAKDTVL